jgi:hypothetical protein
MIDKIENAVLELFKHGVLHSVLISNVEEVLNLPDV